MPEILEKFKAQEQVTFRELILNDYYCLWKTFKQIQKNMKYKLSKDCYFNEMVDDLFKMTKEEFNLSITLRKWKKRIANNKGFILKLCDQMIEEDKIKAIPNILKLSKYRNIFAGLFNIFKRNEDNEFTYIQDAQYQEIEEDNVEAMQNDFDRKDDLDIYVQKSIHDQEYIMAEIKDIECFIAKLYYYKDPLDHNFYRQVIYNTFVKYYQSITFNVNIWENERQFEEQNLKSIFNSKKQLFIRYATFYFFTSHSLNDESKLQLLIKLANEYGCQELELLMLKRFIQTYYNIDEHNQTNRYETINNFTIRIIEICKLKDGDYFPAIECLILQSIHGLQLKTLTRPDFQMIINQIKSFKSFKAAQHESFYSKIYKAKALCQQNENNLKQEKIIKYLQRERAQYSKFFGEQGEEMSRNAYSLYEAYQKLPSDDQSLYYLQKVANYSRIEKKMVYSFKLAKYYKIRNQKVRLIECLKLFQKIDYNLYFILMHYYDIQSDLSKQEKLKSIQDLRNAGDFMELKEKYIDKIKIFQKGLLKLFGKGKKEYSQIMDIYNSWCQKVDKKEIESFNIKQYFNLNHINIFEDIDEKVLTDIHLKFQSGSSYIGSIKNWKLNGIGVLKFFDQRVYEGEFKNNKMHGKGQLITEKGHKYIGNFEEGEFTEGEVIIPEKEIYYGRLENKKYHGFGKLIKNDGQVFEGQFEFNQFIEGKIQQINGDMYEGFTKDMKYDGKGILIKQNGDKFEGVFENHEFISGTVEIQIEEKHFYKGQYSNGQYNGKGHLQKGDDDYDGIFNNNSFSEGTVTLKDQNGDFYMGEYSNQFYQGQGKLVEQNGNYFEGTFKEGKFLQGKVKISSNEGEFYEGEYANGMKNGYGVFTDKDGIKLEGNWKNDKLDGPGFYYLATGDKLEGIYQNSEFISGIQYYVKGQGIRVKDNGDIFEGIYENQKLIKGVLKSFLYNGEIENDQKHGRGKLLISLTSYYEGQFEFDLFHGDGIFGTQHYKYQGQFQRGLQNGKGKIIFNDGSIFEGYFIDGIGEGEFIRFDNQRFGGYFHNDKFYSGVTIEDGIINGQGIVIKDNGNFYDGIFEDDLFMNGKCITEDYEGEIVATRKEGYGVSKNIFGKIYEGEWFLGKYHGKGKIFYCGNVELECEFFNGKPVRNGRIRMHDGQEFTFDNLDEEFQKGDFVEGEENQWKGLKISKGGNIEYGLFEKENLQEGWIYDQVYAGFYKNGFREGIGEVLTIQFLYQGDWVKSERSGYGTSRSNLGNIYKGFYSSGSPDQAGTNIYIDGCEIQIELMNGELQPDFKFKLPNGININGKYKDKKFYLGQKVKGIYQGYGLLLTEDDNLKFGLFKDNVLVEGQSNTWALMGEMKQDQFNGFCQLNRDAKVYKGEFANNKKEGSGIEINRFGEFYKGNFENNLYSGNGILVKNNGLILKGQFKENKLNGEGILTYKEGLQLVGQFDKNIFVQGQIKYGENTYEGENFDDRIIFLRQDQAGDTTEEGFCLIKGSDFIYQGKIINKQRIGSGKLYYFSGQNCDVEYDNDNLVSQIQSYKYYQRIPVIKTGFSWNPIPGQMESIIFQPKIHIKVVGFGMYEKKTQKPFSFEWRYRLDDEVGNEISSIQNFMKAQITYDEVIKNDIINFIFTNGTELIEVKAYQQLHIIIRHLDDVPYFYGEGGENYKQIENIDSECFEIKNSSETEIKTCVSKGMIPALIYF